MKTNWHSTLENLPEVGQKVWYFYTWIGLWEGIYEGEIHDEWLNETHPCFRGERNYWQADCETFWCDWTEEKPEPPEGFSNEEIQQIIDDMNTQPEIENAPNFNDFESLVSFLKKVQTGEISCRKGARYLFETFDEAWLDGLTTFRSEKREKLIKLSEIEQVDKYREFVELAATPKRPDGTYNYCREALQLKAKELL
jgi:hypothetical protein